MDVQQLCCKYVGDAQLIDIHNSDILFNENTRRLFLSLLCMKWKSRFVTFELLWKTNAYRARSPNNVFLTPEQKRNHWSKHCMDQRNILIIIQSHDNRKFAAFTSIAWSSANFGKYFYDANAFLVQFDPKHWDKPHLSSQ